MIALMNLLDIHCFVLNTILDSTAVSIFVVLLVENTVFFNPTNITTIIETAVLSSPFKRLIKSLPTDQALHKLHGSETPQERTGMKQSHYSSVFYMSAGYF